MKESDYIFFPLALVFLRQVPKQDSEIILPPIQNSVDVNVFADDDVTGPSIPKAFGTLFEQLFKFLWEIGLKAHGFAGVGVSKFQEICVQAQALEGV